MYRLATTTESDFVSEVRERELARRGQRGSALIGALIVTMALLGLVYASVSMSSVEVLDARRAVNEVRARQVASAGMERGLNFMSTAAENAGMQNPITMLADLFAGGATITPYIGEPLMNGAQQVGAYTVSITLVSQTNSEVNILVRSTGYLPDAPNDGGRVEAWHAIEATVRYALAPSEVFDYGYFINNWGWFYGNTIACRGNIRSNGQFDAAGYAPYAGGQPIYDSVSTSGGSTTLTGYHDDNGDGLTDGNDGGIFASWDIIGAQNITGVGGQSSNQHEFEEQIEMPNLSDLTRYEVNALAANSSITIGGVTYTDAVYGDEAGEKQNLYLVGTAANPIVLNGPVVVRGDVVISGYVTGQGAIYSGGNVYCPNSILYKNGPTTTRPANNTQAATEAWITANASKDFLGLFARENVVVGDYTHTWWQYYVNSWMNALMNKSEEDAGEDGIPNTYAGRDGVVGTEDDDLLEDDGVFTIDHYTDADALLGLIPPGSDVGDPIPGTGEDIDGDGVYDDGAVLADVMLGYALNTTNFGGNMPGAGIASYSSIASVYANRFDAVFYTNHSFCWLVLGGAAASINGVLISRNENIVYGTPSLDTNYDCRLLGGASSMAADLLPLTLRSAEILRWNSLDEDPNRYVVAP